MFTIQFSKKVTVSLFAVWISVFTPAVAWAQEASPSPTPTPSTGVNIEDTGPQGPTGPQTCTGAGCKNGLNQGFNQGGPTYEQLGGVQDEETGEWILPEGAAAKTQGGSNGIVASNSQTGAESTNTNEITDKTINETSIDNTISDVTDAVIDASTGENISNFNSGDAIVETGDVNIGITQVKNDNTTAINGGVGITSTGLNGNQEQDLVLSFNNAVSLLTGEGGSRSVRAINDGTGYGSENDVLIQTTYEDLLEVQNDGEIVNNFEIDASTGENLAGMNTGNAKIVTGDANVAATLVNLLNTTVINGKLAVDVYDIFGDLYGNVEIPSLGQMFTMLAGAGMTTLDATNENTGSDSTNAIDVEVNQEEVTKVANKADIDTNIEANVVTGQNDASMNTGASTVKSGDAAAQASNISVANTTVEGGNWALVIVNSLNRWVGYLVGDSGEQVALSQQETLDLVAQNSNTGSDSDNVISIEDNELVATDIKNDAHIENNVLANVTTGKNEATKNTKDATIETGDGSVTVTAVNIANTIVKNANLGIAVVNVMGDWFGDLLYDGASLVAGSFGGGNTEAQVAGVNTQTGSNSDNTIDFELNHKQGTEIDNSADLDTTLVANLDTGNNKADKNTGNAVIETGDSELALHSRSIANITGIADGGSLVVDIQGENGLTGSHSNNEINATINDERVVDINNEANVSTVLGSKANTGDNSASYNTGGAVVTTGDIVADAAVNDLVNRVILAMGGAVDLNDPGLQADIDLLNHLTGSNHSLNNVAITRAFLLDIFNQATVDTLVDFLFNTGGNTVNANTGSVSLQTGSVCVDGQLVVNANEVSGVTVATSADVDNSATIVNGTNVNAVTGENQLNANTGGSSNTNVDNCNKIAQLPDDQDDEISTGGGTTEDSSGGNSGGSNDSGDEGLPILARIAGAKVARAAEAVPMPSVLAYTGRSLDRSAWLWFLFAMASLTLVVGARRQDLANKAEFHIFEYISI